MWEIKNTVVVVIFILLRHNSLCERLTDSNHSYTEEPVLCTNFHVCVTLFVRDIDAYSATLTGAPLGQEGRPLLHYLKTKKSVLILERKDLTASIIGLNFPFKM